MSRSAPGYQPRATNPGATNPGATNPGATNPGATKPRATNPGLPTPGYQPRGYQPRGYQTPGYQPPVSSQRSTSSIRSCPQNGSPSIMKNGEPNIPRSTALFVTSFRRSLTAGS